MCSCSVSQSCLTLCDPMNCSLPGSSVHGILQARILEWVAISFSGGSSRSGDRTCMSCVSCIGRQILYHWATWEALWHRISTNECYASVTILVITVIQRAQSSWLPHLQMRKWRLRTVKKVAQSHTAENRGQAGKSRSSDPTVQTTHQKIF